MLLLYIKRTVYICKQCVLMKSCKKSIFVVQRIHMELPELLQLFSQCREESISGRYISPDFITDFVSQLSSDFTIDTLGHSVENRPIHSVKFGSGKVKILMWSQMHGNESTTTKALLDFCHFLQQKKDSDFYKKVIEHCTFFMIPMLNPDGSKKWTRVNANEVDLNRDSQDLSQPESKILRSVFDEYKPDYCFNLHGQRTIYGFEETGKPSILSFLAPSADEARNFTFSRKRSASVITHIFKNLSTDLDGNIGLYNDAFNNNCVGDAFQEAGVPTILFEAGHYPEDYAREQTRSYVFAALIYAIEACALSIDYDVNLYKSIPEHSACYCDVHEMSTGEKRGIYYVERVENEELIFEPQSLDPSLSKGIFAYKFEDNVSAFKLS